MPDLGSSKQKGSGLTAQIFIWGGILLLIAGALLMYPYVSSRLATFAPTATLAPSLQAPVTFPSIATGVVSTPTLTFPNTHTPTPTFPNTHTPTPTPTPPHLPTPTPPPTSIPAPAQPSRIVIPSLNVDGPIIPISWETIDVNGQPQAAWGVPDRYAAGWHETSAPLGSPGNTVLNGHNTTHGEIFRYLYTLKAGDEIAVYAGEIPHTYAVTEVLILPEAGQPLDVRLQNARHILPTEDERLTIVTCHPYGSLEYRLIVIAHPVGIAN